MLIAQAVANDTIVSEVARLQRNYEFLSYGLIIAWLIVVVYVLMMVSRQRKLQREIAGLKAMMVGQSVHLPSNDRD